MKKQSKSHVKLVSFLAIVLALIAILFVVFDKPQQNETEHVSAVGFAPSIANSHIQTNRYDVEAKPYSIPAGAYLFQQETKSNPTAAELVWIANTVVGDVKIKNTSSNTPEKANITAPLDMNNYPKPSSFTFYRNGEPTRTFTSSNLSDAFIRDTTKEGNKGIKFLRSTNYGWEKATAKSVGGTKVHATYELGGSYDYTDKKVFHTFPNGVKKYTIFYSTPFEVAWSGYVEESKEIRATSDFTTSIGQTSQLKAEVRSKTGNAAWSTYYDKTTQTNETTWRSDNPSVVSVDSKGKITALKNGTATIHVNWKSSDGDYHITTKTVVTVQSSPYTLITGDNNVCFNTTTNLKVEVVNPTGSRVDVTKLATTKYTSSNIKVATVKDGIVTTFGVEGKVTITVQAANSEVVKYEMTVRDCSAPPPSIEDLNNEPPTVEIIGNDTVTVGEMTCYQANASDSDGYIESYNWTTSNFITSDTTNQTICGYFTKDGAFPLYVTVTDNGDSKGQNKKQAAAQHQATVVIPKPQAYINVGGLLKENRRITATPGHAYGDNDIAYNSYPITKQTLTIEALDSGKQDLVKIVEDVSGNVDHTKLIQFLAKFSGEVKLTRYVENSLGYNDTFTTTISIAPDLPPVVDFSVVSLLYRDPSEEEGQPAIAKIFAENHSYSTDGDYLNYFEYDLEFDIKNDGTFADKFVLKSSDYEFDKYYEITNNGDFRYKIKFDSSYNLEVLTTYVGKYKVDLTGFECFGSACEKYPLKH